MTKSFPACEFPFQSKHEKDTEGNSYALFYSLVNKRGINVALMQMVYFK